MIKITKNNPIANAIKSPTLVDINKVIPDYSLFDEKRFLRPLGAKVWKAVSIETYRGCPYTCSFCNIASRHWTKIGKFPLERVKKEIIYIAKRAKSPNLEIQNTVIIVLLTTEKHIESL